jgi:hypothetical protein
MPFQLVSYAQAKVNNKGQRLPKRQSNMDNPE